MGNEKVDLLVKAAIWKYLEARKNLLEIGEEYSQRIGGNDNLIGRIGEFIALRFLESLGQNPRKMKLTTNPGYDLRDGKRKTQVKVITAENQRGRTVPLKCGWTQLVLVELDIEYQPARIGLLTKGQHKKALKEKTSRSKNPVVSRSMLGKKGLIGDYGKVYLREEFSEWGQVSGGERKRRK